MSAKRPAPYSIDQKTLQPIPQKQDNNDIPKLNQQKPSERQIFKVKSLEDKAKQPNGQKDQDKDLLFSNLFTNNNGVGLFNNKGLYSIIKTNTNKDSSKVQPPPVNLASTNLFTGNGKIFPKPQIKEVPSIFQKTSPSPFQNGATNTSLFQNAGKSIFSFGSNGIPPVRAGQEEDDGDSEQLAKAQQMKIDKSKSKSNYEYKQQMKVLFTAQAKKYKKNDGDLIENVQVIVQFKEETNVSILVVRLTATKHNILNGILVREKTQIRFLNNKEQNVQLFVLSVQQGKSNKQKIKLQFESSQLGKKFYEAVKNAEFHDNNDLAVQKKEGDQKEEKQSKQKKQ